MKLRAMIQSAGWKDDGVTVTEAGTVRNQAAAGSDDLIRRSLPRAAPPIMQCTAATPGPARQLTPASFIQCIQFQCRIYIYFHI